MPSAPLRLAASLLLALLVTAAPAQTTTGPRRVLVVPLRYAGPPAGASDAAMDGYRSGRFPDGSVIVFDNHETFTTQGTELPGRRRFIDVMVKTGGSWRFGEFAGDSRTERSVTVAQGEAQCASCHAQSPTDHVYSQYTP